MKLSQSVATEEWLDFFHWIDIPRGRPLGKIDSTPYLPLLGTAADSPQTCFGEKPLFCQQEPKASHDDKRLPKFSTQCATKSVAEDSSECLVQAGE